VKNAQRVAASLVPFCLIFFPAFYGFRGGRLVPSIWLYYMGLAVLAALAPLVYRAYKKWQHRRPSAPRNLRSLGGLGFSPGGDELAEKYPELRDVLTQINGAINDGRQLRFRYQKDDGDNSYKVILPNYVHEHRRHTRHEATLCVNGFYSRQRKHVNFSVQRMSEIEVME